MACFRRLKGDVGLRRETWRLGRSGEGKSQRKERQRDVDTLGHAT
jgi:hypothetical protein